MPQGCLRDVVWDQPPTEDKRVSAGTFCILHRDSVVDKPDKPPGRRFEGKKLHSSGAASPGPRREETSQSMRLFAVGSGFAIRFDDPDQLLCERWPPEAG